MSGFAKLLVELAELVFHVFLDIDQLVARRARRLDELVEFELDRMRVAILRVLDQEDHEEREDGRAGIDKKLPRSRELEEGTSDCPADDETRCSDECPAGAHSRAHTVRDLPEDLVHVGKCTPKKRRFHGISPCYSGRMNVLDIYLQYKIPSFLQLHQLRVAAVSKTIADSFESVLDTRALVIAALFHDMGNIIKFDLTHFPETSEPEGVPYWQKVKDDYIRRFGPDEHHATIAIAHELHLPLQAVKYMEHVGFSHLAHVRDSHSYEQKIVEYADCRVAPYGVLSMKDRLDDMRKRYEKRRSDIPKESEQYDQLFAAGEAVEWQIFAKTRIKPEDITEESIQPLIKELRDFKIG